MFQGGSGSLRSLLRELQGVSEAFKDILEVFKRVSGDAWRNVLRLFRDVSGSFERRLKGFKGRFYGALGYFRAVFNRFRGFQRVSGTFIEILRTFDSISMAFEVAFADV